MQALLASLLHFTVGSLIAGFLLLLAIIGFLFWLFCQELFGGDFEPPLLPESDDPLVTNP